MLDHLKALTKAGEKLPTPGIITFTAYRNGRMLTACGDDHVMWVIAVGKDDTATIYMHKDSYAKLQEMGTP